MSQSKRRLALFFTVGVVTSAAFSSAGRAHIEAALCSLQANAQLLQSSSLTYVGAFRLPYLGPSGSDWVSVPPAGAVYNAGAAAMGFNPANNSLIISVDGGLNMYAGWLGEVSIPTPKLANCARIGAGCTGTELNEAVSIQAPTDLFRGALAHCGGTNGCIPRGVLATENGDLFLAAFVNYDGAMVGSKSHYKRSTNFSSPSIVGPVELNSFGANSAMNGGTAGGFQTPIPAAWQSALGGDTLAANWNISINSRASWGPSAIVYRRGDIGSASSVPAKALLYYNAAHPTLGTPQQRFAQWNDIGLNDAAGGVVFVEGTSTILFFNSHTDQPCYGQGTNDPALHGKPAAEAGNIYCYDTEVGGKGAHGNPWTQRVLAYDANDLAAVKNGSKKPWEVVPYAFWDFEFPQFQATHFIKSVAYDPATQRIFMASMYGDGVGCCYNAPLIHVYQVNIR